MKFLCVAYIFVSYSFAFVVQLSAFKSGISRPFLAARSGVNRKKVFSNSKNMWHHRTKRHKKGLRLGEKANEELRLAQIASSHYNEKPLQRVYLQIRALEIK